MERIGADDHPLSASNNHFFTSGATGGHPPRQQQARSPAAYDHPLSTSNGHPPRQQQARTPAASLIQSAARSLLDNLTPSTIFSDERSENLSCADGTIGNLEYASSPTLRSLAVETLPGIPDEQDRRRFIGCLAAILASAFDYEDSVDNTTMEEQGDGTFSYLDYSEVYDDDEEYNETISRSNSSASDSNSNGRSYSFESMETQDTTASSLGSTANPATKSSTRSSRTQTFAKQRSRWPTSSKEKARVAKQRHRRRRYTIASQLLISSSELLLLDKSVAKAFLPMLSRVLVPQAQSSTRDTDDTKNTIPRPPQNYNTIPRQPQNYNESPVRNKVRSAPTSPADKTAPSSPHNRSFSGQIFSKQEEASTTTDSDFDIPRSNRASLPEDIDKDDVLRPFLESLTPGAGFRCLSLLLLQHLLSSETGYDARIRHLLKKVGVIVLVHDMRRDPVEREVSGNENGNEWSYADMATHATRKFESLEHSIARRLILLSENRKEKGPSKSRGIADTGKAKPTGITKENILRGVKIGSAGIVAGTIFAVTGGLAAPGKFILKRHELNEWYIGHFTQQCLPGIAAGVAAVAGSAAATAAVVTLTSTAVVTTIFGVGGGSLAAYKMQRRTQGLTEFEFRKETSVHSGDARSDGINAKSDIEAELFSTICISGWLRDKFDYQRPWGLHPTSPRLNDRLELLERFYSIHSSDHIPKCPKILSSWKGEEQKLWGVLELKYGRDPDHLFPLDDGQRFNRALTLEQEEILDKIFVELGYNSADPDQRRSSEKQSTPLERMRRGWGDRKARKQNINNSTIASHATYQGFDSMHGIHRGEISAKESDLYSSLDQSMSFEDMTDAPVDAYKPPKHLATVWDYKTTYGGELYTVRWESELLQTICDCVLDLAVDVVSGATVQILRQTILSTLVAAVIWPTTLLVLADMIDGEWTLAVERADEAGRELARTLLYSRAGRRPVTLVGFSFGARVIYSCLKELARLQEEWQDFQEKKLDEGLVKSRDRRFVKLKEKFEGAREPSSIVEDAIMMGLPNHLSLLSWEACRRVVAGRLVNCYSTNDLILSLMFQAKRSSFGNFNKGVGSILKPVCGTCPVHVPGVENVDVSDIVSGHQDYCLVTGKILERVHHGQPLRYNSMVLKPEKEEQFEPAKKLF